MDVGQFCVTSKSSPPHTNRGNSFVEFETAADLKTAVEKLDNQEFKGATVHCVSDVCYESHPTRQPHSLI